MKANYDHRPEPIEPVGDGSFLVNYEIQEVTKDDRTSFDCSQVAVPELTKDAVIRAIMRDRYPRIDDEIAIINNAADKPDEYAAYQNFRAFAKNTAIEVIS